MKNHRIRLVIVDLDNTVLSSNKTVSDRGQDAISAVRDAGVPVIPATSRGVVSLYEVLDEADFGPWAICSNGAVTIEVGSRRIVDFRPIGAEEAAALIDLLREAVPDVSVAAETVEEIVGEQWFMRGLLRPTTPNSIVADLRTHIPRASLKILFASPSQTLDTMQHAAEVVLADRLALTSQSSAWLEVSARHATKAGAAERLLPRLGGVTVGETLAIGDGLNDLDLLRWAGFSAAVSNAVPAVLAVVDVRLSSHDDDGVAELLEKLVADHFHWRLESEWRG